MATGKTPKWPTRGECAQAVRDTARIGISAVVQGVASGIIEVGASTPLLAPLCVALLKAKGVVDGVSRNKDELEGLGERCDLITVQVIDRCKDATTPLIDVFPLFECVKKLAVVAQRYHDQGWFARLVQLRKDGDDIRRLRDRVEAVVPIMGLAGCVNIARQLEDVREVLARLQPRPTLATVPKGAPMAQPWHTVRDGVVDRVCEILGGGGEPTVAALTGRSGSGKTTAAAAMVGERGATRPRAGETEDQARIRLDRVRALFPDGVVWLRVGREEGATNRLPPLMRKLAKALHEDVKGKRVDAPTVGEDSESYVKKIISQEALRCLVVADDVWQGEVVEKLRKTGMWVLLTTRNASVVKPNERVVLDELEETEAEDVLRGAARLPPGERLCDDAMRLLKICGHVAMDIAFVGSWSSVRTADNGVRKSSEAWADAVRHITTQINDVRAQAPQVGTNAGGMDDLDVNRLAVLRAGFKYLGAEDPLALQLYVALAVFPDGHAFEGSDAAVLLNDGEVPTAYHMEVAVGTIAILERWAVLTADTSGLYRVHDAHVNFARGKLMGWEDVRKPAVRRWTSHISRLNVVAGIDMFVLLEIWRALERVGGEGWWASRPYDAQLVQMDASDCLKICAVMVVANLYWHDQKLLELEALMRKVLECRDDHGGAGPGVKATALWLISESLDRQGRYPEHIEVTRQLGELGGPGLQLQVPNCSARHVQLPATFHAYGICAAAGGLQKDAEEWFRKALKVQEDRGFGASLQTVFALCELGNCVRGTGRPEEAQELFKRALDIAEANLRPDDPLVAGILTEMGRCANKAGRPGEAEGLFRRALEGLKVKLGSRDELKVDVVNFLQVAKTLHELGRCAKEAGRPGEAEGFFKRALEIKAAKMSADDPRVAVTLHELGRCAKQAGRPEEAKKLLRRALEVFKRALEIKTAAFGADDLKVASTMHELGLCLREAGRPGEATAFFKRALEIKKAKLGADDDPKVAFVLQELGRCAEEAGTSGEEAVHVVLGALDIEETFKGRRSAGFADTVS